MKTNSLLYSCTLLLAAFCHSASAGTVADEEAGRIGAVYRYTQGLAALMIPNLSVPNIGYLRAGPPNSWVSYPCPGGGSVAYLNDQPSTNPVAPPKSKISWSNCSEAIGTINGSMAAARGNATGAGGYNISWNANVTIDGYTHRFKSASSTVDPNAEGGKTLYSFGGADTEMVFATPSGELVMFTDAHIRLRHNPSTATLNLAGTDVRMRHVDSSDRLAKILANQLSVPAASGFSAYEVGAPTDGSFNYVRSFDATNIDVTGTGTAGTSLSLTLNSLQPQYTFPGDSGIYSWSTIINSPNLTLPATAP